MGIFDVFYNIGSWISEKVEDAKDWFKGLSRKKYNEESVEDQVDVDATLAEFREEIQEDVENAEKKCMSNIATLFTELEEKT